MVNNVKDEDKLQKVEEVEQTRDRGSFDTIFFNINSVITFHSRFLVQGYIILLVINLIVECQSFISQLL